MQIMKLRPKCVHCGAGYGTRAVTEAVIVWHKGEPRPPYRGNGRVIKDREHHGPRALLERTLGRPTVPTDDYAFLDIWDGETFWHGRARPFCSSTCAIEYARQAYLKNKRGAA
jgi:hypothetical protein